MRENDLIKRVAEELCLNIYSIQEDESWSLNLADEKYNFNMEFTNKKIRLGGKKRKEKRGIETSKYCKWQLN